MKIVISMSGSLLTNELTLQNFQNYSDIIKSLWKKGHKIIVTVGGGSVCRQYQRVAKEAGADDDKLDFIGIMSTHLNASTFAYAIGDDAYLVKWKPLKQAMEEVEEHFGKKIIVAGGYDIGTSSDYDAAMFAQLANADIVINATNIDGVYSDDPRKNPDAKKYGKIGYKEFIEIIKKNAQKPGEYRLFDLKGAELLKKIGTKLVIVDGRDRQEIINAVEGKHNGTVIS
ncbi:UMP kinase [archaeon]|nr:MAG: UMP kinase [archaeon]